jgi:microcystin-dependent protein
VAEQLTPNFGWTKPDPGASPNTWGTTLNATTDKIDNQCFVNQQAGTPVGSGALWFTNTPPANWLICDGSSQATATYPALFAVIGYTFGGSGANFNLPALAGRFPFGVGAGVGLAAVGGESAHTLSAAELAPHAHSIVDVAHNHSINQSAHNHGDPGHSHGASGSQDAHSHNIPGSFGYGIGVQAPPSPMMNQGSTTTDARQPNVYVSVTASGTGIQANTIPISLNASGTGLSTTQNAGSGASHNNMPPFIGINMIIKFQ